MAKELRRDGLCSFTYCEAVTYRLEEGERIYYRTGSRFYEAPKGGAFVVVDDPVIRNDNGKKYIIAAANVLRDCVEGEECTFGCRYWPTSKKVIQHLMQRGAKEKVFPGGYKPLAPVGAEVLVGGFMQDGTVYYLLPQSIAEEFVRCGWLTKN